MTTSPQFDGLEVAALPAEEAALLELMVEEKREREHLRIADRTIARRFEKFRHPVGLDDAGNAFALPPPRREDRDA